MEADQHRTRPRPRREFVVLAAAAATGAGFAIAAASGGSRRSTKPRRTAPTTAAENDAKILSSLLDVERRLIAAYSLASETLHGHTRAAALSFLTQERQHAAALERAIRDLGATPSRTTTVAGYVDSFPRLRRRHHTLDFLLRLEEQGIAAYLDALELVSTEDVRVTTAAIMTAESEHAAALLGELDRPQLPSAFVTGTRPPA